MKIRFNNEDMTKATIWRGFWRWRELAIVRETPDRFTYEQDESGDWHHVPHWVFALTDRRVEERISVALWRAKEYELADRVERENRPREWVRERDGEPMRGPALPPARVIGAGRRTP